MSSTPSCLRYHFTFTVFPPSWLHLTCPSTAGFAARTSSVMSKIMEAIHSPRCPDVIGRWITLEIRLSLAFRFFSKAANSINSLVLTGTASQSASESAGCCTKRSKYSEEQT
jgi:hypothetical protein